MVKVKRENKRKERSSLHASIESHRYIISVERRLSSSITSRGREKGGRERGRGGTRLVTNIAGVRTVRVRETERKISRSARGEANAL